jgi:hypothetical protein
MNIQIFPTNCSADRPKEELLDTYLYIFTRFTSSKRVNNKSVDVNLRIGKVRTMSGISIYLTIYLSLSN